MRSADAAASPAANPAKTGMALAAAGRIDRAAELDRSRHGRHTGHPARSVFRSAARRRPAVATGRARHLQHPPSRTGLVLPAGPVHVAGAASADRAGAHGGHRRAQISARLRDRSPLRRRAPRPAVRARFFCTGLVLLHPGRDDAYHRRGKRDAVRPVVRAVLPGPAWPAARAAARARRRADVPCASNHPVDRHLAGRLCDSRQRELGGARARSGAGRRGRTAEPAADADRADAQRFRRPEHARQLRGPRPGRADRRAPDCDAA